MSPKLYPVEGIRGASCGCLVRVYTAYDKASGTPLGLYGLTGVLGAGVVLKWVWKAGVEMAPSTAESLVWGWMHRLTPIHFRLSREDRGTPLAEMVNVLYDTSCNVVKGGRLARVSETTTSKCSSKSTMLSVYVEVSYRVGKELKKKQK